MPLPEQIVKVEFPMIFKRIHLLYGLNPGSTKDVSANLTSKS